jgi:hypothetical protein
VRSTFRARLSYSGCPMIRGSLDCDRFPKRSVIRAAEGIGRRPREGPGLPRPLSARAGQEIDPSPIDVQRDLHPLTRYAVLSPKVKRFDSPHEDAMIQLGNFAGGLWNSLGCKSYGASNWQESIAANESALALIASAEMAGPREIPVELQAAEPDP